VCCAGCHSDASTAEEMNIRDFLIDLVGKDWDKLLAYWRPPLKPDSTLWFVNLLGEAFLVTPSGGVQWLAVGTGALSDIAPSREAFARSLDRRENADLWLRISLVEGCQKAGMRLTAEECYGFKIPPALMGNYDVPNLQPANIYSHYSWLAHITRQDEIYWTGD
jgi:hypothetical protein